MTYLLSRNIPIYKNGYLEMVEITDKNDMKTLLDFLNSNELEKDTKVLMKWVKCEGAGKNTALIFHCCVFVSGLLSKVERWL